MRRAAAFGILAGPIAAEVVVAAPASAALPGAGIVTDAIGGASGWAFDKMASGVASWVLGGVAYFADGVLNFLKTSGRPQVEAAWFAGPGSPLATVRNLAAVLMGGFVFLGLLQGLVRGDPGAMIRRLTARPVGPQLHGEHDAQRRDDSPRRRHPPRLTARGGPFRREALVKYLE